MTQPDRNRQMCWTFMYTRITAVCCWLLPGRLRQLWPPAADWSSGGNQPLDVTCCDVPRWPRPCYKTKLNFYFFFNLICLHLLCQLYIFLNTVKKLIDCFISTFKFLRHIFLIHNLLIQIRSLNKWHPHFFFFYYFYSATGLHHSGFQLCEATEIAAVVLLP